MGGPTQIVQSILEPDTFEIVRSKLMKIYGDNNSGNCLKVKYTADCLDIKYEWIDVDITQGASRKRDYLRVNPQGQVPAIQLAGGRCLAQSNAIIRYLAKGTALLPEDPYLQARVDELLFWEQYSHEPYIAVCRTHMFYRNLPKETREPWRVELGEQALDYMEQILADCKWLVADAFSIADIALLAYTRVAHEGGFDLSGRPCLKQWISRCEEQLSL